LLLLAMTQRFLLHLLHQGHLASLHVLKSGTTIFKSCVRWGINLSNGHSPANLANSSTRQIFAVFGEYLNLRKRATRQIFVTRVGEFGEYWANLANLANLASLRG
jgi:hypothetical protein